MPDSHTRNTSDAFDTFLMVQLRIAIALVGVISLSFITIPLIILPLVNRVLKAMPDLSGHIKKITLNLWDGTVNIYGMSIEKKNQLVPVAFFTHEHMKLSLRITKRRLVADWYLNNFCINLVKGIRDEDSQLGVNDAWMNLARKMLKLSISRLEAENGNIHFRTYYTSPQAHVEMTDIHLVAENLNIGTKEENVLPADMTLTAKLHGGNLKLDGKLNPRSPVPTFDANFEMTGLRLEEINSVLLAFAKIDVSRGVFNMSSEIAAKNRRISGYIKPVIQDIKLFNWKADKKSSVKKIIKELFIDGVVSLFKNHKHDQLATKIVIDGEIQGPSVNVWSIIGCMFFNAFVESLLPHIEDTVTIQSVGQTTDRSCLGK